LAWPFFPEEIELIGFNGHRKTLICDVDGTLANVSHREHFLKQTPKNWKAWFEFQGEDTINPEIRDIVTGLVNYHGWNAVVATGREDDDGFTASWLEANGLGPNVLSAIYMRAKGDRSNDDVAKSAQFDRMIEEGYNPVMVLEDRARVVKMWRAKGLRCLAVAEGDF
jgi:hypothetical protein